MKIKYLALASVLALSSAANAHKMWIKPSQTVLSGEKAWVAVDLAASNDIFVFNHVGLNPASIVSQAPDGSVVEAQNPHKGKIRSGFELLLDKEGTYRISAEREPTVYYSPASKSEKRWRGTLAEFKAKKYPKGLNPDNFSQYSGQTETFVTLGKPSKSTVKASDKGLDVEYLTHPNELYQGEEARFKLVADGKPAANAKVVLIRNNSQYRNDPEAIELTTNAKGELAITWDKAGMYWLNARVSDKQGVVPSKKRSLGYTAIIEVLPQ